MDYGVLNKLIEGITANTNLLSTNVIMAASRVTDAAKQVNGAIVDLNKTIKSAGEAGDRQATAMRWLTIALVVVGILQIFVPIIYSRFSNQTYVVCVQTDNNLVCKK